MEWIFSLGKSSASGPWEWGRKRYAVIKPRGAVAMKKQ